MKERGKRGQLTIFIILAILVVAGVAVFFLVRGGIGGEESVNPEVAPVYNFVQECLDDVSVDVVYGIAERGGYYYVVPSPSTDLMELPYYLKDGNHMPTLEDLQNEVSRYVAAELALCTAGFVTLPEYQVKSQAPEVETVIYEDEILIDVKYPLNIVKGESTSRIEDFGTDVPLRLGAVYDAVNEFITAQESSVESGVCVDCLLDATIDRDLYATFFDYDDTTKVFMVRDPNNSFEEREFIYMFANEY